MSTVVTKYFGGTLGKIERHDDSQEWKININHDHWIPDDEGGRYKEFLTYKVSSERKKRKILLSPEKI